MVVESEIATQIPEATSPKATFGNFILLKTTAYARIWRASRDGKYFLIKTTKDNSEAQLRMLRREYELSIGCNHPHIVHIYTYEYELPVGAGIVMEYIEGTTLSEWLATSPTKSQRRRVFGELLSAVGYLHHKGIIHNDLKPDNILISRADNSLKIIDFGLSDNDAFYAQRGLGRTPHYASPELMAREVVDARSDIYSIGVIMGDIFGGRYGRISRRCKRNKKEDRYANIDLLGRDWHRRNLGWLMLVAILLATLIYVPIHYTLQEHRYRHNIEKIISEIDGEVGARYELSADSVATAKYQEFALDVVSHFYYDMWLYHSTELSALEDDLLRSEAMNFYSLKVAVYNQQLWEAATSLPSLDDADLSPEQLSFYRELLFAGKSYEPCQAE